MDIREYMQEYDPSFDLQEFETHLWEAMQEEDFEFNDDFYDFLIECGISDIHSFLRRLRIKKHL